MAASMRNVCVKNIRWILCHPTSVSLKYVRCYTSKLTEKNEKDTKAIYDNEIILENNFYLVRLEENVQDLEPSHPEHQTDNINVSESETPDNNRIGVQMPFGKVFFDNPVIDINQSESYLASMEKDKHKEQKSRIQPSNYSKSSKELAYLMSKIQSNEQPTNISLEEGCEYKKENKLKKKSRKNLQKQEKRNEKKKDVGVGMREKIDMDLNGIPTKEHIIQTDNRTSQCLSYEASAIRKESTEKLSDTANSNIKSRNVIPYQKDIVREEQTDGNTKTNVELVRNKDKIKKHTSTTSSKVKEDTLCPDINYVDQQYFEMVESAPKQDYFFNSPGPLSEKMLADGPQNYEITEEVNLNYVDQQYFENVESVSKEKLNTSVHNSFIPEISLEIQTNEGIKDEKLHYVDQQYFGKNDPLFEEELNIAKKKQISRLDSLSARKSQEHEDLNVSCKINNEMQIEENASLSEITKATTELDIENRVDIAKDVGNRVDTAKDVDSRVDTAKGVDSLVDTAKGVDSRVDTAKCVDSRVDNVNDIDSRVDTVKDSSENKSSDIGSWIDLSKMKRKVVDSTYISSNIETLKTTHQRSKTETLKTTHQRSKSTKSMTASELPADSPCDQTENNKQFKSDNSQPIKVTGDVSHDLLYDNSQPIRVTGALAENNKHYGGLNSEPMKVTGDVSCDVSCDLSHDNKHYGGLDSEPMLFTQDQSESNKRSESESKKPSDKPKNLTRLELLERQQTEIDQMISEREKLSVGNVADTNISDLMRSEHDEDEWFEEENASPAERVAMETRKEITGMKHKMITGVYQPI